MLKLATESLEYLNVGYIVSDPEHRILIMNRAAQQLLSTTRPLPKLEEVITHLPDQLQLMDHVTYCGIEHRSCSFRQVALGDKTVRIFLSPIFEGGELTGTLLTLEDVSEKVAQEHARDQFLSFLVHELRTPLTAVKGNSSLLEEYYAEASKDERFQQIVGYISAGSQNVLQMVNQFLDMARLEEGRIEFDWQQFELAALIRETAENLQVLAKERGLTLTVDMPKDLELQVVADPVRTRQVLTNLIGNGLKFTEQGGVTISVKPAGETVEIAVTDTGAGIPADSQAQLFQKYFQASNNKLRKDSSKSTGLGLYVTRLMAEGMGGRIYLAKSELGKGSTFAFTLDIATPDRLAHLETQRTEVAQGVEHGEVSEHTATDVISAS